MSPTKFKVSLEESQVRLDRLLAKKNRNLSRAFIQKLIKRGDIQVNNQNVKPSYLVQEGDEILIKNLKEKKIELKPVSLSIPIIYKDEDILIINKPPGIPVHPGSGQEEVTVISALLNEVDFDLKKFPLRPGIVHRLDKEASGLLIIARNERSYYYLINLFKKGRVVKKYLVLVKGRLFPTKGIIEAPLSRSPFNYQKMQIALPGEGKEAITYYKVKQYFNHYTLLEVEPKTGRTHQIRVHFASIGHPVFGDRKYGRARVNDFSRLFLHAFYLKFKLPSGKIKEFTLDLPDDLKEVLEKLNSN